MNNIWNGTSLNLNGILGSLGNLLGAIIVFLIGWLIAKLIANGIQKALEKSGVVNKLSPQKKGRHQRRKSGHLKNYRDCRLLDSHGLRPDLGLQYP